LSETISAVLITLNEEKNLPRALAGLHWVDEIIIADTGSIDNTLEVARGYTKNVFSIPWQGFGDAYNRALDFATRDWIYFIHADEEMTPELESEIRAVLADGGRGVTGYYVARLPNFLGYWLRHGGWYPSYEMRLFRRGKGRCNARVVHQDVIIEGKTSYLKSYLLHYTDPSMETYLEKMNRVTTMAALELFDKRRKSSLGDIAFRPLAVFFKMFMAKCGFLDGFPGLLAASLSLMHVFIKYVKLRMLWRNKTA